MLIVSIIQEMHWTYFDYMDQPTWFINLVRDKLLIDNERIKKQNKNK
jgi:hypothetical protein